MTTEVETAEVPVGLADGELRMVSIEELHPSSWNPRQYYPDGPMNELIESMRTSGFREWLPILVRPDEQGGFEIGAGHRRHRAATEAGIRLVPCIVRAMTDEQFLDVLNFDNTGREDVHPLHEAGGWRQWMEKTGKGVLDIAARIGQSKEYVYQRLKYAALIESAAKAFLDGAITAGHAILIARLEPKAQEGALKFALAEDWQGRKPAVRALADHLHRDAYVDLRKCAFDGSDRTLLAGAGACGECPKRAANIPGFEFDPEHPEADLCTDRSCHQQKVDNHLQRIRATIETDGETVLSVSDMWAARKKGVRSKSEYDIAKPGTPGARQALVVEGEQVGQVITVRLKSAPSETRATGQQSKAEVEKASQARKAKVQREISIRKAILVAACAKVTELTRADLEALLAVIIEQNDGDGEVLCELHGLECKPYDGSRVLAAALPKFKDAEIRQLAIEIAVVEEFDEWHISRGEEPKRLLALAKRYKVDAVKIRREMEEAAKEAEGGTRKEVIQKLPTPNASAKSAPPAKKTPAKKAPAKKAKPAAKKKAGKK